MVENKTANPTYCRQLLQKIIGAEKYSSIEACKVQSVSGNNVNLITEDGIMIVAELFTYNNKSYGIEPEVNSYVLVGRDFDNITILSYSKVKKITMNTNVIQGDGSYGGAVKIEDLTTKLNDLVSVVNSLITSFKTHVHTSASSGSPTTPPVPTPPINNANNFSKNDYENTTFVHGKIVK